MAMKARMKGGPRSAPTSLTVVSKMWPTAIAGDAKSARSQGYDNPKAGVTLTDATTRNWSTPTSRDGKGLDAPGRTGGSSLPAQVTALGGPQSSNESRVLNPRFVEMLMGLPTGWALPTPLGTINCGYSAMESSHSKLPPHSESSVSVLE